MRRTRCEMRYCCHRCVHVDAECIVLQLERLQEVQEEAEQQLEEKDSLIAELRHELELAKQAPVQAEPEMLARSPLQQRGSPDPSAKLQVEVCMPFKPESTPECLDTHSSLKAVGILR